MKKEIRRINRSRGRFRLQGMQAHQRGQVYQNHIPRRGKLKLKDLIGWTPATATTLESAKSRPDSNRIKRKAARAARKRNRA